MGERYPLGSKRIRTDYNKYENTLEITRIDNVNVVKINIPGEYRAVACRTSDG